jgi:putative spermidine/putrescine transport system permease protein
MSNEAVSDRLAHWLLHLIRVLVLAVVAAPIVATVVLSFSSSFTFPPTGWTLHWYRQFFGQSEFVDGLKTSLLLATATVCLVVVLGTGLAYVLTRYRPPGSGLISGLVMSPLAVPRIACGVSLLLFFIRIGVTGAFRELLLLHVIVAMPFVVGVIGASLRGIDPNIEHAAMNLGANRFETFRRITLPLVRPGLIAAGIFAFVVSLDEVTASTFLVDAHTTTFPVVLFAYMERGGIDPTVAAASTIFLVPVLALMVILERYVGLGRALGIRRTS